MARRRRVEKAIRKLGGVRGPHACVRGRWAVTKVRMISILTQMRPDAEIFEEFERMRLLRRLPPVPIVLDYLPYTPDPSLPVEG